MFPIIPFTALYSVFNFIFVSAIPAADDFIHYNDPGCPLVNASSCNDFPWCKRHRHDPDLFDERVGFLNPRDIPEPEDPDLDLKVTREHDVNRKRANNSHYTRHSVQCGTLASVTNDVSAQFQILRPWRLYDLIVDYPYDGATGEVIGIFAKVRISGTREHRIQRVGAGRTSQGGLRFSFRTIREAIWYQVFFLGDDEDTAAINYYVILRGDA